MKKKQMIKQKTKQSSIFHSLFLKQVKDKKILFFIVCAICILLVIVSTVTFFPKNRELESVTLEAEPLTEEQMASLQEQDVQDIQTIGKPIKVFASSYDSESARLHFDFKSSLYVTETVTQRENWLDGSIVISTYPEGKEGLSNMVVVYGIPEIQGKGGACPEVGYTTQTILGQRVAVCDDTKNLGLSAGYPKHPEGGTDYFIYIYGKKITSEEYQMYKDILYSGMRF